MYMGLQSSVTVLFFFHGMVMIRSPKKREFPKIGDPHISLL